MSVTVPDDLTFLPPFGYSHGWRDIVNDVSFDVDERRPQDTYTPVWQSDDTIALSLGQSAQVQAKASDPFREALNPLAGTDVIFSGPGTVSLSTVCPAR